jgi:hypothetical protein
MAVPDAITAPSFLTTDGNTVGWWDYNIPATVTKDGNSYVSGWTDKLGGSVAFTLADNGGGASITPLWTTDGIRFGMGDSCLSTGAFGFTIVNLTYYIVMKVISTTASYNWWIEGVAGARPLFYTNGAIDATKYFVFNGTEINTGISINTSKFIIARVQYNSTSSFLKIDGSTYSPFDSLGVGTNALALGRYWSNTFFSSNYIVKELIVRRVADNITNETSVYNYLKSKYSL